MRWDWFFVGSWGLGFGFVLLDCCHARYILVVVVFLTRGRGWFFADSRRVRFCFSSVSCRWTVVTHSEIYLLSYTGMDSCWEGFFANLHMVGDERVHVQSLLPFLDANHFQFQRRIRTHIELSTWTGLLTLLALSKNRIPNSPSMMFLIERYAPSKPQWYSVAAMG